MIQVVVVKPNHVPVVTEIENELLEFQKIVDGYIESLDIGTNMTMLFNEEGSLLGMQPCISVGYTTLLGPVIFVGKTKNGEFASLRPAQIDEAMQIIQESRIWS